MWVGKIGEKFEVLRKIREKIKVVTEKSYKSGKIKVKQEAFSSLEKIYVFLT